MTPEFNNLLSFSILAIIGFLWIKSFKILLRSQFVFGYVERWFIFSISMATIKERHRLKKILEWIEKPVYKCVFCMASVHGLLVFTLTRLVELHSLSWWVLLLYLPVLMGVVTLYYADPFDYEIGADE